MYLSKYGKISFNESNAMSYNEFTEVLKILSEHLKKSGPSLED